MVIVSYFRIEQSPAGLPTCPRVKQRIERGSYYYHADERQEF